MTEAPTALNHTQPAFEILWQDEDMLVVYKPAGWLVHRTTEAYYEQRILLQALRAQLGRHLWPVHRLDQGTCGVLVFALNRDSCQQLSACFATHAVDKRYLAFVRGWLPATVHVDHALRPDDAPRTAAAQPAQTTLHCLARLQWDEPFDERFPGSRFSLVEARPLTGRRHQIRRHLKHVAHPIIGDATHGKGPLNRWWAERIGMQRLWLHAHALHLPHPRTGEVMHLCADWRRLGHVPEVQQWLRLMSLPGWQACEHGLPDSCGIAQP